MCVLYITHLCELDEIDVFMVVIIVKIYLSSIY